VTRHFVGVSFFQNKHNIVWKNRFPELIIHFTNHFPFVGKYPVKQFSKQPENTLFFCIFDLILFIYHKSVFNPGNIILIVH